MKLGTCWVALVGLSLVFAACGGDSEGDDGGGGGKSSGVDWRKVNPPDNIDIATCVDITYDEDELLVECSSCCSDAGYSDAGFINDDHCTCGNLPDNGGNTVCIQPANVATSEACFACCEGAEYSGYVWGQGMPNSCMCLRKSDTSVCQSSLEHSEPDEACSFCCLENGFLSNSYIGIGARECNCLNP